ncbi:MAG: STAS domain-containing protein [Melioribacteraceae bacterium]|nr:STAS domain-containing protein [Melioribacteraceae bacterium]MCF8354014.1 STAS domain-containing protein [Melioribacteraceae bacterium]MCF8392305.1 STAS domain-containing protein [Melioribacteraceae bacterium]MCF8417637.1 STAS domain-containing protein [Melioribacteraceae bacterium]
MDIKEEKNEKYFVLSIVGRLDASTAGAFEEKLLSVIDSGEKKLLINFGELDYISSSGLRVLLVGAKKVKALEGKIALCDLKSHIMEVFEIAGFTPIFDIYSTYEEAINS